MLVTGCRPLPVYAVKVVLWLVTVCFVRAAGVIAAVVWLLMKPATAALAVMKSGCCELAVKTGEYRRDNTPHC